MSFIKEYSSVILFMSPIVIIPGVIAVIMFSKLHNINKSIIKGDLLFEKGNYDQAIKYYTKQYRYASKMQGISFPRNVKMSMQIAKSYTKLNNYKNAEKYALNAFDYYNNILEDEHEQRLDYFTFLEEIHSKVGDESSINIPDLWITIGQIYDRTENYSEAWVKYTNAIKMLEKDKNNDRYLLADAYYLLGQSSIYRKKYEEAARQLEIALSINNDLERNILESSGCHFYLGHIYLSQQKYEKATEHILNSLRICIMTEGKSHPEFDRNYSYAKLAFTGMGNDEKDFPEWLNDRLKNHSMKIDLTGSDIII